MECSPNLFYCFSPSCQQSAARVLSKERATKLHLDCQGWIVPEDSIITDISHITQLNLPFDHQMPLTFSSHPIATQAYLCSNKEAITSFLTSYTRAVRHQVLRELDLFDEDVNGSLKKMFDFRKYNEIKELASQEGLSADLKSMRLAQLFKTPLPLFEDARLPNISNSELLITNLRRDLAKLFELKEVQPIPKAEVKLQHLDGLSPFKCTALTPFKDRIARESNSIDQLWRYMKANCNLDTAKIMGQPLQKFYDQGNEVTMSNMKCCLCDFAVELRTKTKPQTNSACSYAILEHLYAEHPTTAMQNYNFACGSVLSLSFQTCLIRFRRSDISSVTIIDSLSLPNIKQLHIEESDFQFQITHGGHKPIFRRVFLKGGNSKSIMALFGLVIGHISIVLNKKLTIYTSELKADILKTFCQFYKIENVKVLSGNEGEKLEFEGLERERKGHRVRARQQLT